MGDASGALALVGSGEYTATMDETDRWLLATLGGPAQVAVIPTASALEEGQPERWNAMGVAHFTGLGAQVTPLRLLQRADAEAGATVEALREAGLYYFSGGNPEHLAESIEGTPAWAVIAARHRAGAVVAGCSAGAMVLGSQLLRVRQMREGKPPRWRPGLGLAEGLAIMPHFDRMRLFLRDDQFRQVLASRPSGLAVVGIDEDTALVRLPAKGGQPRRWQVMGRQSVSVFDDEGRATVFQSGELVLV
ncbi:MAG: type 1 glutamine amidotransferase-like domain-containing protein [Chloroflexales bacterium]|nr:type 1 glutamine amidotransferase-like domain-containing protein [Chloroflexales bacterium]